MKPSPMSAVAGLLAIAVVFCGCASAPDVTLLAPGQSVELFNGRDLTGWQELTEIWFDEAGKVYVEDGALVLSAGHDLTGVRWTGRVLRDDYSISLTARRVDGSDFFCGLSFPVGKGQVTLILGGWGGQIVGLSNVDGSSARENETTNVIEFQQGHWYAVEARVAGGRIGVWIDGRQIIDQAVEGHAFEVWPQQEEACPLGVTSYATTGAIRNIRLKRLPGR